MESSFEYSIAQILFKINKCLQTNEMEVHHTNSTLNYYETLLRLINSI